MNSLNHLSDLEHQQDFFKEKIIPQKFQITINPQKIPLINGVNTFADKDGEEHEMIPGSRVYVSGDKVVIEHNGLIFKNIDNTDQFENAIDQGIEEDINKKKDPWSFNSKTFEKSGDIVLSRFIEKDGKSVCESMINGKKYTIPSEGVWNLSQATIKCVEDKIYANRGRRLQIFKTDQEKLIMISEEKVDDNEYIEVLNNCNIVKRKKVKDNSQLGSYKTHIQVNNKDWKNDISDYNQRMENNGDHLWIWDGRELVINDVKYNLTGKQGTISDHCEISENGDNIAIAFNYNEEGGHGVDYTKLKRGGYILLGDKNGINKEIKLGKEWVRKITVDNEGQVAYVTKKQEEKKHVLHISDFQYEIDMNDDYHAIKEFAFIGKDVVKIRYINLQDEMVEKEISLNPDAEQVKQKLEADEQEAKNAKAMQEWLQKNNISSTEQLQNLLNASKDLAGFQKQISDLGEQGQKTKLELTDIISQNETLTEKNKGLEKEVFNLKTNIQNIRTGITKGTIGYKISDEAKNLLGIDTR